MVRVWCVVNGQVKYGGCGILVNIKRDGTGLVMTANHVVQGSNIARVIWVTGEVRDGTVVSRDAVADIAFVEVTPPRDAIHIPPATDLSDFPSKGDTVELLGLGGGDRRHWFAVVNGYNKMRDSEKFQSMSINTRLISGDSGGGVIFNGKLVAVLWGGPLDGPGGRMLSASATCCLRIKEILGRLLPPYRGPPEQPVAPDDPAPTVNIDYGILADAIIARLGDRLRGPAGPPGPSAELTDEAIALITAEVLRRISETVIVTIEPIP